MPTIKTPDGKIHEITEIDFEATEEPWIVYELSDGTKLKFRTSIVSIVRSNQHDEHGSPYYFVKSHNQVRTYCPKELLADSIIEEVEDDEPQGYR